LLLFPVPGRSQVDAQTVDPQCHTAAVSQYSACVDADVYPDIDCWNTLNWLLTVGCVEPE
jgi:hypothetical protein